MMTVSVSGATRDWLTWHSGWGVDDTCTLAAQAARARLLSVPEKPYGRGYRTTADLPVSVAREVLRCLDAQIARLLADRTIAKPYVLAALTRDQQRLRHDLVATAPSVLPQRASRSKADR